MQMSSICIRELTCTPEHKDYCQKNRKNVSVLSLDLLPTYIKKTLAARFDYLICIKRLKACSPGSPP
ncbi:hypothetical protein AGOR_G00090160 [Albula goreensis]|uniref:Uncharacterized protein n=1 Tax=Albula goreensis TaxID=1534307 RepID=A0A8T3DIS8_9TELE|nr:hypothetical protein AGOR_G00090160 [Albula goreensis]